jgi:hypothetical protein
VGPELWIKELIEIKWAGFWELVEIELSFNRSSAASICIGLAQPIEL